MQFINSYFIQSYFLHKFPVKSDFICYFHPRLLLIHIQILPLHCLFQKHHFVLKFILIGNKVLSFKLIHQNNFYQLLKTFPNLYHL